MIIGTNRKLQKNESEELIRAHFKIPGEPIEQKTSVKYLRVAINNQLKWKDHFNLVSFKISKAIGMIKYSKKVLPTIFNDVLFGTRWASFRKFLLCLELMLGHYPTNP